MMEVKEFMGWFWFIVIVLIVITGYVSVVCFFDREHYDYSKYRALGMTTAIVAIILITIYLITWG